MHKRSKWSRALAVSTAAVLSTGALAACGGDDGGGGSAGGGGTDGNKGGEITVLHTSFPDFLDPGLSYTVDGWQSLHLVYPGLVGFKPAAGTAGTEVVPALAEALPEISEDGKTYKFKLRKNLNFSDGTPLKASDFKGSIERLLEQDSQGAGLGYTNIVGGSEFLETKEGGVDGIVVNDQTGDITIKLVEPRGAFLFELAIPFAGVVPADTPASNQTKNPPPGAGPYMYENVKINRSYTLVKNPKFSPGLKGTDVDYGNVDTINAEVERSSSNAATRVRQNEADFMIDNPPPDQTATIKEEFEGERFQQFATNSSFYFFLNTEAPPFDNLKVRQAVNHGIDTDAINRVQGGTITPAYTILPPGVPGYEESEDLYPFDVEKAKALIKEAGAEGEKVTVWGNEEPETKRTIELYADQLDAIGLDATPKIIPAETYFTTIGDRKLKAQTGWANWFQDYPHPADFIDILLNPSKVVETGNNNYSYNAADKELADKINAASAEPELTDEVIQQWADIDREIQEKAYWGIYGNRKQSTFFSERMDFENCNGESSVYTHDWGRFCLKE